MPQTTVLGSGMAGLMAAWAVKNATGQSPLIYTDRIPKRIHPSEVYGVHVLHDNCGLNIPEMVTRNFVVYGNDIQPIESLSAPERLGANAIYAEKLYGDENMTTSVMSAKNEIHGYNYFAAYDLLVNKSFMYHSRPVSVREQFFLELCDEGALVISSIPRYCITPTWVKHNSVEVTVSQHPPIGFEWNTEILKTAEHFIVYNADPDAAWARTSRLVIHRYGDVWNTEYVSAVEAPRRNVSRVRKVVDCDPYDFPDNALLVGRTGRWAKGYLASDAYNDTLSLVHKEF